MEEYKVDDFGKATFIVKTGWKYPITCYGRIIAIEKKVLLFIDNDENEYIISRDKFEFSPVPFRDLSKYK